MLQVYITILKFFGLIRTESRVNFYIGVFHCSQYGLLAILCILEIFFVGRGLKKLSWVLEVTFLIVAINVKIAITYWHRDKIDFMITFVEQHQNKVLEHYKQLSKRTSKYFSILVFVSVMTYSLKPFVALLQTTNPIDITKLSIYPIWVPFRTNMVTHVIILVWSFYIGAFGAFILSVWDNLVVTMMIFIVGQFRYIHIGVKQLTPKPDYKQYLVRFIHHHQSLIRYGNPNLIGKEVVLDVLKLFLQ